ncbi:MAG: YkgJ family cysteine cluster protein [Bacteroidetes bacterium]|nr:YkgJ family cysteine cluster protein [Bacteroidota bacterium]
MKFEVSRKRVAALAAQKEDENWEFRCYLKGWCDVSSEEIDAYFHRYYQVVSKEIDCTRCANCCSKVSPCLSFDEIEAMAAHLGLSSSAFCDRYLVEDADEDEKFDKEGKSVRFVFKTLPCPLLKDNLCTVYASRPNDCRSYPHLHKTGRVFSMNMIFENCLVCPIVYNVYELMKKELWHKL